MPSIEPLADNRQPPEDEEEPDEISWNLGFVEEPEKPYMLLRHWFPSKVGGRPAWLDPVNLPPRQLLTCGASGRPLDFLLQVYAPVDANPVEGFHRTLFLFISPEGSRLHQPSAVRLLRCQLPRQNPFYSPEPPRSKDKYPQQLTPADTEASRDRDPWRTLDSERPTTSTSTSAAAAKKRKGAAAAAAAAAALSASSGGESSHAVGVAGSDGPSVTAAGEVAEASGRGSGVEGGGGPLPRTGMRGPGGLYPEMELVVEPEDDFREEDEDEEEEEEGGKEEGGEGEPAVEQPGIAALGGSGEGGAAPGAAGGVEAEVRRALQQYHARVAQEGELDEEELPADVVEAVEGAVGPEQRCFADFQARVSLVPQQVVRYCFQDGAQPLWPAPHARPGPTDIPPCPHCGSRRKMEFQVLPQLLHFLSLDEEDPSSPDWSCLVAYTCAASCSPAPGAESAYLEEFVWVQPPAPLEGQ